MNKRLSGKRLKIHVSKKGRGHFPRAWWLFHSSLTRDALKRRLTRKGSRCVGKGLARFTRNGDAVPQPMKNKAMEAPIPAAHRAERRFARSVM